MVQEEPLAVVQILPVRLHKASIWRIQRQMKLSLNGIDISYGRDGPCGVSVQCWRRSRCHPVLIHHPYFSWSYWHFTKKQISLSNSMYLDADPLIITNFPFIEFHIIPDLVCSKKLSQFRTKKSKIEHIMHLEITLNAIDILINNQQCNMDISAKHVFDLDLP